MITTVNQWNTVHSKHQHDCKHANFDKLIYSTTKDSEFGWSDYKLLRINGARKIKQMKYIDIESKPSAF